MIVYDLRIKRRRRRRFNGSWRLSACKLNYSRNYGWRLSTCKLNYSRNHGVHERYLLFQWISLLHKFFNFSCLSSYLRFQCFRFVYSIIIPFNNCMQFFFVFQYKPALDSKRLFQGNIEVYWRYCNARLFWQLNELSFNRCFTQRLCIASWDRYERRRESVNCGLNWKCGCGRKDGLVYLVVCRVVQSFWRLRTSSSDKYEKRRQSVKCRLNWKRGCGGWTIYSMLFFLLEEKKV